MSEAVIEREPEDEWHSEQEIGEKIVEMADRLKVVASTCSGARATWGLEIDGVVFQIAMTVKEAHSND